eukprot:4546761-Amphidinium_carterae.1
MKNAPWRVALLNLTSVTMFQEAGDKISSLFSLSWEAKPPHSQSYLDPTVGNLLSIASCSGDFEANDQYYGAVKAAVLETQTRLADAEVMLKLSAQYLRTGFAQRPEARGLIPLQ